MAIIGVEVSVAFLVDPVRDRLASLVTDREWDRADRCELTRLNALASAKVPLCAAGSYVRQGGEAVAHLTAIREHVESELAIQAQRFSPFKWLWYLRRLPRRVFEGNLLSTFHYDSGLAVCASARSSAKSPYRTENGFITYKIKCEAIQHTLRFCSAVRFLSQVHSNLRWAGKGVAVDFRDLACGIAQPTATQCRAVELYDARMEDTSSSGFFFHRTGTLIGLPAGPETADAAVLVVYGLREPKVGPIVLGRFAEEKKQLVQGYACFGPSLVFLSDLGALNSDPHFQADRWWPDEAPLLLMFLRLSLWWAGHTTNAMANLQRYGYFVAHSDFINSTPRSQFDDAREAASRVLPNSALPDTISETAFRLRQLTGSLWPYSPGPPMRSEGDSLLCLDLHSATLQLQTVLEFPKAGGQGANVRSAHFEDQVQRLIDSTNWRPDERLATLKGREIRHQGRAITDIDAVGSNRGRLLLVSCKSKPYSGLYDAGDYRSIRNEASDIAAAVKRWSEVQEFLRSQPVGDNYDLSSYMEITSVVVTPSVVYVESGPALDEIAPGLRAAVSAPELRNWMMNRGLYAP